MAHTCAKCGARRVDKQIGLEALHDCLGWATGNRCGECHVCVIVEVFRLVREVLDDSGVLFVNYGDSYNAYNGNRGTGSKYARDRTEKGEAAFPSGHGLSVTGLKPKDLVGMPWRIALALQADGWYLRSDIIWAKPNPMPESCTDRPTKSHEYLFLLSKRGNYFYDAEAVREVAEYGRREWTSVEGNMAGIGIECERGHATVKGSDPSAGRNRRTVWTIATESFSEAHFATFPRALVTPCILAGTSQRGHCPECGARWVRVVEKELVNTWGRNSHPSKAADNLTAQISGDQGSRRARDGHVPGCSVIANTLGFRPTCPHDLDPIPDIVLDPFGGSGTVGAVAEHLGRKWILIDLSESYAEMQKKRTAQTGMAL